MKPQPWSLLIVKRGFRSDVNGRRIAIDSQSRPAAMPQFRPQRPQPRTTPCPGNSVSIPESSRWESDRTRPRTFSRMTAPVIRRNSIATSHCRFDSVAAIASRIRELLTIPPSSIAVRTIPVHVFPADQQIASTLTVGAAPSRAEEEVSRPLDHRASTQPIGIQKLKKLLPAVYREI